MSIESIGGVGDVASSLGTLATGFGQGIGDMDNAQMTRGIGAATGTTANGTVAAAPVVGVPGAAGTAGTASVAGTGGDFASLLAGGIDKLQGVQSTADDLALRAATGELTNVHDYMIASNEAQLATQLTVAIRNKAVDAFNEIMRMQV